MDGLGILDCREKLSELGFIGFKDDRILLYQQSLFVHSGIPLKMILNGK